MARILPIIVFLTLNQTVFAQSDADSLNSKINTFELIGIWKNMTFTLERYHQNNYSSTIGSVSDQRVSIPVKNENQNQIIIIESNGILRWEKHLNARWKLEGNSLVVTTEFGATYKGLVTKDPLTNTYMLTLDSETYKK